MLCVWSTLQAGLLRTENGELWLEPVRGHRGDPGLQRPHVVFKRSAPQGNKKRKRKRKKRHEKNCGTRGKSTLAVLCCYITKDCKKFDTWID
jgi:hypothetical protein